MVELRWMELENVSKFKQGFANSKGVRNPIFLTRNSKQHSTAQYNTRSTTPEKTGTRALTAYHTHTHTHTRRRSDSALFRISCTGAHSNAATTFRSTTYQPNSDKRDKGAPSLSHKHIQTSITPHTRLWTPLVCSQPPLFFAPYERSHLVNPFPRLALLAERIVSSA